MNQRSLEKFFQGRGLILLGLIVVLLFNLAVRWRIRDVPLERDEGEYAYAGQLILQGIPPYQFAYNMKFPGVYFSYAILMAMFGETARGIHLGIALVTSATAVFVFLIGKKLLNPTGGLIAAANFVVLSLSPAMLGFVGHATHFVALFATIGAWALLPANGNGKHSRGWALCSGVAFGLAVLMKQHALFFAPLGLLWLVLESRQNATKQDRLEAQKIIAFLVGCPLPILVVALALTCFGVAGQAYFWTLKYASEYVSVNTIQSVWMNFSREFFPIFKSTGLFWILGMIGFVIALRKRCGLSLISFVLFLGGLLAVIPGFYFRNHYFLAALPGLALLNAVAMAAAGNWLRQKKRSILLQALPVSAFLVCIFATAWNGRGVWFDGSPDQISRRTYGLNPFIEAAPVAGYLKAHTSPDEKIAVLGSEPEIYFLARRHSATGYIYMYPLTEPQLLSEKMRNDFIGEIESAASRYVVLVNLESSWISVKPADRSILNWWADYSTNYELVGAVDMFDSKPTEYFWGEQLNNRTNHTGGILMYQKK